MRLSDSSSDQASGSSLALRLLENLSSEFERNGWNVQHADDVDLVIAHGPRRYVVELKVAREPRRPDVQGALADAILRAKHAARGVGAKPLAVVGAPHISDAMAESLREYANRYADGCPYGMADLRGRMEFHGPGLSDIGVGSRSDVPNFASSLHRSRVDLFSDLGQWLLKVLLAPSLPESQLSAPRVAIRNAKHLGQLANVSIPHVSRQVAQLRKDGFLEESGRLRLVRVADLLEQWRAASRKLPLDIPARWMFPAKNSAMQLRDALRKWSARHAEPALLPEPMAWVPGARRVSLALFAACDALGLGFVSGAPVHIYAEDVSDQAFQALGLVPGNPGEKVDVFVRQPKYAESVFRGAAWRDRVACADVLQCWLDVSDHPVRGEEQANQIWNRVLKPNLLEA